MLLYTLHQPMVTGYMQAHPPAFPEASLEPIDPFNLTSFALALLLAFRLDASYNRYMRGRELWGTVVCDSRDLVRKVWPHLIPG